mgnify:CR=1 FL=1
MHCGYFVDMIHICLILVSIACISPFLQILTSLVSSLIGNWLSIYALFGVCGVNEQSLSHKDTCKLKITLIVSLGPLAQAV